MAAELLPVVDLRTLSQSDVDALAAASAHALAPGSRLAADPLPPLKIDRAVFNESAGSRRQTFSRLRLAAANSSPASARPASSSSAPPLATRKDPSSDLVAYRLRRLFVPDDPSLPPPETLALTERSPSPPPDPDRETTNSKGVSVDLVRLAGMGDPYDGELRRRTAGLASETELMGFISSLAGKWATQRRRRKFVDASFFGDHLPRGWKLLLGLKRKEHMTSVHCFSYVSPKGSQFATCKEVSAYLMSLLGYPEAKTVTIQYDSTGKPDLRADDGHEDAIGFQHQIGSSMDNPNVLPVTSVTFSSYSGDLKDTDERNLDMVNAYECQKCNLTFQDKTSYLQHNLSSHEMAAKRRRTGKFGEPVVGKDGKFECPVCHKTFAEESRYFGHVGAHARYQGMTPETFLDKITSGKVDSNSLAEISFSLEELTGSSEQNNKSSAGEAGFQHLSGSNEHGNNSSKDLFSTNCLNGFDRPNEAWHRPEVITSVTYAPGACNVTVPKVTSSPYGQPDGRLNCVSEVTVFSGQMGSHHAFRSNTFGNSSPYVDQIIDHGIASKHDEVNSSVKARDVNLNSHLDTSSFRIARANNETSTALNEASQSPFAAECFSGSFSNNAGGCTTSSCSASINKKGMPLGVANKTPLAASACFSASYGSHSGGGEANLFGNKDNTGVCHSNMGMRPISSAETNAGCFPSHLVHSEKAGYFPSRSIHSENSDKACASSTKERMDNIKSRASNDTGFGIESYNNNSLFGGVSRERGFAQFSSSFTQTKSNISSRCSLPESNMLKAGNLTKGSDVNFMKGSLVNRSDANSTIDSFVNRPIRNNESNVSMHGMMGKSSNEMQNRDDRSPACVPRAAVSTSENVNGLMSTQANFGSMSGIVRSVGDAPMNSTAQDQCDLQLGFGAQKQQMFSGTGEPRTTTSGSPQPCVPRNNSLPTGSSQFGSMARPNSFPAGFSEFGSLGKPNFVPTSFQFGIMARPDSVPPSESSHVGSIQRPNAVPHAKSPQFGSMARPNCVPSADSSQYGSMTRPNCVPPADSSQYGTIARPNCVPPANSSQFGIMFRPNSAPHAKSSQSQFGTIPSSVPPADSSHFGSTSRTNSVPPADSSHFGSTSRTNSVPPADSSHFGSMSRTNSVPPAEASQFGSMPRQNFVSGTEPTLVLGYAPQMGNGPPVQVEWDLSSSKVTRGMMTCVCIWCNSQFHHFGPADGQQTGSFGFICPACKEKMSRHSNMPSNGSWQP